MGFIIRDGVLLKYLPETENEITIPYRVREIAKDAFNGNENLFKVNIPGTVKTIGEYAFCGCKKLCSVNIDDGVEHIEERAFSECHHLRNIVIPKSVYGIGESAFGRCTHLTEATIKDGVGHIGDMAFEDCEKLRKVNIPDSIRNIGDSAFYGCTELTDIFIPSGVSYIGDNAFSDCPKLRNIKVSENNSSYYTMENTLLRKDFSVLVKYFGTDKDYTVPDGILIIAGGAFSNNSTLRTINIPDSVIEIYEGAFCDCVNLKTINLPDSVVRIKRDAFIRCSELRCVNIPNNIKTICGNAFTNCENLEQVKLPENLVLIQAFAFYNCVKLKNLYIPESVKYIHPATFLECNDLIIITPKGSYAEKYAKENNIPVRPLQVYEGVNMTADNQIRAELHLHTNMSEMGAVGQIEEYILFAKKKGIKAVAVTDNANVRVFPEAYHYAAKHGVKLIYGMEGYLDNGMDMPYHITVLAKNKTGLKSLYEIVSASHTEFLGKQPLIPKRLLEEKREHLIVGSACSNGELYRAIKNGDINLKSTAGFYDYLEVQPFNDKDINKKIVDLGEEMNIPVIATSDAHYVYPKDQMAMKVLVSVNDYDESIALPTLHIRTPEEMISEFEYLGYDKAFEISITNTSLIADMIDDTFESIPAGKHYPVAEGFENSLIPPDIEIRTSEETREMFIDYLKKKFGEHNVLYPGEVRPISGVLVKSYIDEYQELSGRLFDEETKDEIFGLLRKVTRSTGTLPGGIVIIPPENNVNDFTPVQCAWNTVDDPPATHFDYKFLKDCLYKITVLIKQP